MYKQAATSFIFVTLLTFNGFSQDNWNRYAWGTPEREGFAVLLPFVPTQINKANGEQRISAFEGEPFKDSDDAAVSNLQSQKSTGSGSLTEPHYPNIARGVSPRVEKLATVA